MGVDPAPLSVSEERQLAILTELPFVVPFEERVKVSHHFNSCIFDGKSEEAICVFLSCVIALGGGVQDSLAVLLEL